MLNMQTALNKKKNINGGGRTVTALYPANVCSVENGTAKEEYQNGMFAGGWIILKELLGTMMSIL